MPKRRRPKAVPLLDEVQSLIAEYRQQKRAKDANRLYDIANELTSQFTAFATIERLVEAQKTGYRPRFILDNPSVQALADIYDLIAESRGLPLRAHRVAI